MVLSELGVDPAPAPVPLAPTAGAVPTSQPARVSTSSPVPTSQPMPAPTSPVPTSPSAPSSASSTHNEAATETPVVVLRQRIDRLAEAIVEEGIYSPGAVRSVIDGGELDEDYDPATARRDARSASAADAQAEREEAADDADKGAPRRARAGAPLHVRVPFNASNVSTFNNPSSRQNAVNEIFGMLELLCQGSPAKCAEIFDAVLARPEFEATGYHIKIAAFDRFAEALEWLKPRQTGYHLFYASEREDAARDVGGAEPALSREVARRWRALNKDERTSKNAAARGANGRSHMSASASEENRKLFRFALKLVAPKRPLSESDSTSHRPKLARLLRLNPRAKSWLQSVEDREKLDNAMAEAPAEWQKMLDARAEEEAAKVAAAAAAAAAASSAPSAAEQEESDSDSDSNDGGDDDEENKRLENASEQKSVVQQAWDAFTSRVSWLPAARKQRSDITSPAVVALIEKFWHDNTTASPSERDVRRVRVGRAKYEFHQTHFQYKKVSGVWRDGDYCIILTQPARAPLHRRTISSRNFGQNTQISRSHVAYGRHTNLSISFEGNRRHVRVVIARICD